MNTRSKCVGTFVAMLLVGAFAGSAFAGGGLKAHVKKDGERCKRTVVKMDADQYCAKAHESKVGSENCIVSKDGNVMYAVVYVKDGLGDQKFDPPADKAVLDQHGCMYIPHVLSVQVGQTMIVRNSDDTLHNIHSFAEKQRPFNFAQPTKGSEKEVSFTRPEFVKVRCDVHPWMHAIVAVFDNPFHAVTDKEGACEIADLPPGEYTIGMWHEELGELEQKVTIAEGETAEVEFAIGG